MQGRTIGVLSSLFAGVYFGSLITSVARAAADSGGRTVAIQTHGANWSEPLSGRPMDLGQVGWDWIDGFIAIIDAVTVDWLHRARAVNKPVVLISRPEPNFPCPVVLPDNRSGVTEAVEHLLAHGHTSIAFTGNLAHHDITERYEAYQKTLREHGIAPDPALFFPAPGNDVLSGRATAREMMAAGMPSTAVFCATDYNALGLMEELKAAGYSLPQDQAVIGFRRHAGNRPGQSRTVHGHSELSLRRHPGRQHPGPAAQRRGSEPRELLGKDVLRGPGELRLLDVVVPLHQPGGRR